MSDPVQLESGTYEILRNRLKTHAEELRARLDRLNAARKDVFGSIDLKLLSTERVTTEHNCTPRDIVSIGSRFLFGYNVQFGLKAERHIGDVFALYDIPPAGDGADTPPGFHALPLDPLRDPRFEKDFQEVYRYYKNATFQRFLVRGPHLFMVFQVGKTHSDIKSFKWLVHGDELRYLDNRSDHEVRYPPQHEFDWTRTTRDMHRHGAHPHISIADRLFVETVGGDLTIKVENNTSSGEGLYSEPVDNADQTLDDAEVHYAVIGHLILLKIRPYQETAWRYILFNEKLQQAIRLDAIADACVLLPDDHGLIFSSGYYLQTGERKLFETNVRGLVFDQRIVSPNGEDTLFVFSQPESGAYVLLGYNLIKQTVETPVVCNGFTLFKSGRMVLFKSTPEPQKHHAIQVWQTPYVGEDYRAPQNTDSYLYKIGNRDIVRAMAECHEVLALIDKDDSYSGLYVDLVKQTTDVLDSYFWINHDEAANLSVPLKELRSAASAAVDEFQKVVRVRRNTEQASRQVSAKTKELLNEAHRRAYDHIDAFVQSLASLRGVRGEIIGLKELRYIDLELVDKLEQEVADATDKLAHRCVEFLLADGSLQPYADAIAAQQRGIESLKKVTDAKGADEKISQTARELEMLIEIVSNLKIDDATQRTAIIDNISAIFSTVNTARAGIKRKTQELASVEGSAEFASQLKLLGQSVVNFIDLCDSPAKCDEFLTKLMVQVEELEGKFAEFDEFIVQLAEKREEISGAFDARRTQLVERRNKRAAALMQAAERILKGVKSRVEAFTSINEIHGFFASDLMIEKVRGIVEELSQLGDSVKVDDLQSRLKTVREDAVRQLKDKQELFEGGQNVIRFGKRRFSVNAQQLDLTTLVRDGKLLLHLTGTSFYEPVHNAELDALLASGARSAMQESGDLHPPLAGNVVAMEVPSENEDVYRGEYLAYRMLMEHIAKRIALPLSPAGPKADDAEYREQLLAAVQQYMSPRYREGYLKGVHDHDAAAILRMLVPLDARAGLLRYTPLARTLAALYWNHFGESRHKKLLESKLAAVGTIDRVFASATQRRAYREELRLMLKEFLEEHPGVFSGESERHIDGVTLAESAEYLFNELRSEERVKRGAQFIASRTAVQLVHDFQSHVTKIGAEPQFAESLKGLAKDVSAKFSLARDWLGAWADGDPSRLAATQRDELTAAALLLATGLPEPHCIVDAELDCEIAGLVGSHPVIAGGNYSLRLPRFLHQLRKFETEVQPRFERYHELKTGIVQAAREELKLSEFQPKVLTSFVRNKLINDVYLPLIGDNLAKQIGTAGESKRTDRQGLLLLISPPGYGKTTLMEYIANRLGIIFMKVNGPAIGHAVTSLDPNAAPNAGAREEIEKLNLAFEMGDNVMIYVDDIQHTHPEFLQKFISLCDAQRKVEGVWKGKSRTYDFRGKKVAVVMAGNPYTESGEKFQIPDMLANRADIYNLGEIIGDSREAFEMSYLENSMTSNPVLARLSSRSQNDVYAVIKLAEQARRAHAAGKPLDRTGVDFEGSYSAEEVNEFVAVMVKLLRVRDVVLTVNREYIASAAQHDDYRTEPPFLLQGSYRNMNRIAERVLPVLNDRELETLIHSSYQNDAQTLTRGTESNLLKFKELLGILTPDEQARWDDIRRTFKQNVKLRGVGTDDKVGQVIATLTTFSDGLDAIRRAVSDGVTRISQNGDGDAADDRELLGGMAVGLRELAEKMNESLHRMEALAQRPIQLDVPPIEMKWPEHLPTNGEQTAASVPDTRSVRDAVPAESPASERITIVNKMPRAVYQVIESQFGLMEKWLKPLTELSARNQQDLSDLRPMIEECLETYRDLMARLPGGRESHE